MMKDYIPRFSDKEYERRHRLVRDGMDKHGVDCLLIPASESITYLTNISMIDFGDWLLFPRVGDPTLFANLIIYRSKEDRTKKGPIGNTRYWGGENSITIEESSVIKDIRGVYAPIFALEIAKWIKERGYEHGTVGVVGRELEWAKAGAGLTGAVGATGPMGLKTNFYNTLTSELPNVTFTDKTEILREVRIIKSPEEIESIKNATRIADLCGEAMFEEMRKPGVRETDLFASFWNTIYRNGGGYAWWFMAGTTQTSDPKDFGAHVLPYDYTLREGDIFFAELLPMWRDGYVGHGEVCFVLGEAKQSMAYTKMNEVCLKCYNAVVDCLRPGATTKEIRESGDKPVEEAGYMRGAPLAYSIGLFGMEPLFVGLPEDPSWMQISSLRPGMTIMVISHIYDQSTNVCVRTGSTHLITEGGNQCLNHTSYPRGLVCVR